MVSKTINFGHGISLEISSHESRETNMLTGGHSMQVYYDVSYKNESHHHVNMKDALDTVDNLLFKEIEKRCKKEREQATLDFEYNKLMEEIERRGMSNNIVLTNDEQKEENAQD